MPEGSLITAVLGPTNTGKTHRAVERMLEYDSGMIGLPLRLLAREVYDRVTTRVGESRVALVTGEEKRVPRRADYWICTVEAMPTDREVDFLAVDEIQLAAHDQRGHVFTERLLSSRGRRETWFLGAETMRPLVSELVPTARFIQHPRLSRLESAGAGKLSRLPPRSAVVVFSMPQVYELAERMRALRGGAAVVLGALSPRTRNAQVALFQSGEVDYLVATDAIGMGLNLDVRHVAFAALRKFDGRGVRELDPAELAQIAGRAGRHLNDGTFGTVAPLSLPPSVCQAIEAHRFAPVRRLLWRNSDVDSSSLDALVASLRARPHARCLKLVEDAEDTAALHKLVEDPAIRARASRPEAVQLLWDVCRIPDFRKLLVESHVALLAEIYAQLTGPKEVLDADWMNARIAGIDDVSGDIDTLVMRIASIRTWTYISNHGRWVRDAASWQERTRAIEDRLSDALHERLVQRFVERGGGRRGAKGAGKRPGGAHVDPARHAPTAAPPADASHPFARIAALRAALPSGVSSPAEDRDVWVEAVVAARHDELSIDAAAKIFYGRGGAEGGARLLGRLTRGTSLLLPDVRLVGLDDVGPGARSRVLRRLVAYARDLAEELLAPLRSPEVRALPAAARGLVYQIEQGLGTALVRDADEQLTELTARDRGLLQKSGVEVGERVLYVPALLRRRSIEQRLSLCVAWFERAPVLPSRGAVSLLVPKGADPRVFTAIGYPVFGTRAIRADVAERVHRALTAGGDGARPPAGELASWMGCPARELPRIFAALSGVSGLGA